MKAASLPTATYVDDFFPTPEHLAKEMLSGIDWDMVERVLEPSAGRGDLAKVIAETLGERTYRHKGISNIACIEPDEHLRATLVGKGYHVVHDDFLTYNSLEHYQLIVMNPPFSHGAEHLLKALTMLERYGGSVVCLLNAETITNPYTSHRQQLVKQLNQHEASITYMDDAFLLADRKTDVQVALIRCTVPQPERAGILLAHLRESHRDPVMPESSSETTMAYNDYVDAIVARFDFEANVGVSLIEEYRSMVPYMQSSFGEYPHPILEMKVDGSNHLNVNTYLAKLRRKYWETLLMNKDFTHNMTSNLRDELYASLNNLERKDFSHYNILQVQIETRNKMLAGIKQTILQLFDDWTHKYSYHDGSSNIHYYNGWKTNDAFKVKKKVIIPFYQNVWSWMDKFNPTSHGVYGTLADMQMVFDYLCGELPDSKGVLENLRWAENNRTTTKIPLKYFRVTFYKKGTMHVEFTNEDALYRFNLFAAKDKGWLPPVYGKVRYTDMDDESRAVIDSFEGEASYENTMANWNSYLDDERFLLPIGTETA